MKTSACFAYPPQLSSHRSRFVERCVLVFPEPYWKH